LRSKIFRAVESRKVESRANPWMNRFGGSLRFLYCGLLSTIYFLNFAFDLFEASDIFPGLFLCNGFLFALSKKDYV
jgi:hypothetical protein